MRSNIPTCSHIRADGNRCRSAALRGEDFCYYHVSATHIRRTALKTPDNFVLHLPPLDCHTSIHAAIDSVAHAIAAGQLHPARANAILRAIQCATNSFEHLRVEQISCRNDGQPEMPIITPPPAPSSELTEADPAAAGAELPLVQRGSAG